MGVIEALLAFVGLVVLSRWLNTAWAEHPPAEPVGDRAAPYVDGLHAAFRIQQAAWEAEQQLYAEAARYRRELPTIDQRDHA